ncbi:hypothetical protein [Streptomyces sp. NPDC051776]|uniref:hypothetical protein n=1 Tax=Streptomyces sp. NPDC051776 TaxID=3155414 RepID=UPI0034382A35
MPTPYGSRGAMAFSADELRVLRRALAIALRPSPAPSAESREEEIQELCRLTEAVEVAVDEGERLRAFLFADLARYRAALPGAASGFLERLVDALSAGYTPGADDLAALRSLCAAAAPGPDAARRRALLRRCEALAEQELSNRLAGRARRAHPAESSVVKAVTPVPSAEPAGVQVARLVALPGGRAADDEPEKPAPKPKAKPAAEPEREPERKPEQQPGARPKQEPERRPSSPSEQPGRHVPTPAEVFPPRRRKTPPEGPPPRPEQLVAV